LSLIDSENSELSDSLLKKSGDPLARLLQDGNEWYGLDSLARLAPQAFVYWIWPWLLQIAAKTANDENEIVIWYRSDASTSAPFDGEFHASLILKALLIAITDWARQDFTAFLNFVQQNIDSEFMIVHRFLARGLEGIAPNVPAIVLSYLLDDPRRLIIGDWEDHHQETKRLISAVFQYLTVIEKGRLEKAIIGYQQYKDFDSESSASELSEMAKFNHQHRLRLLRTIPYDCLSSEARLLKDREEGELPNTPDYDSKFYSGTVGAPMTVSEMSSASDEDIQKLIDELPDETAWDNPKPRSTHDFSRAGGAIQQARVLAMVAQESPERIARLVPYLKPNRHELYAGAAVEGIAKSNMPASEVIRLFEMLCQQGFTSDAFKSYACEALEKLAQRCKGLPPSVLQVLESWLDSTARPVWQAEQEGSITRKEHSKTSILFGAGFTFSVPSGRGAVMKAIVAGYLKQEPPNIGRWATILQHRLVKERHPAIWVQALIYMPVLFNGDTAKATTLYDSVIRLCPQVLGSYFGIYGIARIIGRITPKEMVHGWLENLLNDESSFCRQAYGELLVLCHFHYRDDWSKERIRQLLVSTKDLAVLCGLAHAASHLWYNNSDRSKVAEILTALAASDDESIQIAVAGLFHWHREQFDLSLEMRIVITAVLRNTSLLIRSATELIESLVPYTGTDPELVFQVCKQIVSVSSTTIGNPNNRLALAADSLTSIALTLHRQSSYREAGMWLFEQLLSMNVREARSALEILDRKPSIKTRARRKRWPQRPNSL